MFYNNKQIDTKTITTNCHSATFPGSATMNPAISVIVPVYKVEKYLNKCIDSILSQTFTDFELILVDDGSPDNCPAICDEYAMKDERIKVIHKENGGLSSARNAGLDIALGEFVCFIDSDDFIHHDFCNVLYQHLNNSDALFCACRSFDFTNYDQIYIQESKITTIKKCTYLEFFQERLYLGGFAIWNKMFRRELFNNIRFQNGKIHEDIFFSSELLKFKDSAVILIDSQLYFYLMRKDGIIGSSVRCSPDRVASGAYMIDCVNNQCPQLLSECVYFAVSHPWSYVDSIYVKKDFKKNKKFLKMLQNTLRQRIVLNNLSKFSPILQYRIKLFSFSKKLYALNAFSRLARVYLYKIFRKDPYIDGHGI